MRRVAELGLLGVMRMKLIKNLLLILALIIIALFGAVVVAEFYRRVKYPNVPRHEADVFFDIGMVFLLSFAALTSGLGGFWFCLRKRRAIADMAIICPYCGVADQVTKMRHKQLLSLEHYIFGFITGLIGILIWYFSLESKFLCGKCSQAFFARTPVAKVFRVLFHILVTALVIGALIMISIIVFPKKP